MVTHSLWAIAVAGYLSSLAAAPEGLDASGVGSVTTGILLAIVAPVAWHAPASAGATDAGWRCRAPSDATQTSTTTRSLYDDLNLAHVALERSIYSATTWF